MAYEWKSPKWKWRYIVYDCFKGVVSVSSSIGCDSHIAQVWLRVSLDDCSNVICDLSNINVCYESILCEVSTLWLNLV